MHKYMHHIGDFMRDTAHLSPLEECYYRRAMDFCYLNESPLPKETQSVFRRLRAKTQEEQDAVLNVLADFFTEQDDGYHNRRCDAEIAEYQGNADKNRENGKKGGRPPKNKPTGNPKETQSVNLGYENETQTKGNQQPTTNNHKPITNNQLKAIAQKSENPLDGFEEFWQAYPRKTDRKKAETAWAKIKPDQQTQKTMLNTIAAWSPKWIAEPQYTPHPTTWLNGERWNDAPPPVAIKTAGTRTIDTRPLALRQLDELQANEAQHHNMIEVHS